MSPLAPPFLIGSFSIMQVARAANKAWMGSKFGKIGPEYAELAVLERLIKYP